MFLGSWCHTQRLPLRNSCFTHVMPEARYGCATDLATRVSLRCVCLTGNRCTVRVLLGASARHVSLEAAALCVS